ncbi:hypothetical protein HQ586_06155 [Candidatus Bathyarchaeota archaeon]|nr:hypothetical protein [Candidatus Bathyarchaeota archaeon]
MNIIDNQTANMCPNCRDSALVWDPVTGEIVCRKCGLVIIDTFVNSGPERAAFTKSEEASRKRVGLPPTYLMPDKGLPTAILQISRDAYGKKILPDIWQQMYRLKKPQNRYGGAPRARNTKRKRDYRENLLALHSMVIRVSLSRLFLISTLKIPLLKVATDPSKTAGLGSGITVCRNINSQSL